MTNWLDELLSQTAEYESPKQFFYWSGLAALSATVKDKVWIQRAGKLPLYLNIYVLLFARSGLRKGPPIDLAKRLVRKIGNTRVISGRSSIEAIVEDLKEVQTLLDDAKKPTLITDSCGFITASEFSSAIVHSEFALNILTDLYDRKYNEGSYDIRLIRTGKQTLKSPTITMLGGINEAHFQHFLSDKDISGGFLGRTFVIHADTKNTVNSLMYDMEREIDEVMLVEHLKFIEKLKGPLNITEPAKRLYHNWYTNFYSNNNDDKTGTHERIGDSALKIAGLLSLANSDIESLSRLEVSCKDIDEGIAAAEKLTGAVRQATFTISEDESISTIKKKILKILVKRVDHKTTRMRLLNEFHGTIQVDEFNKIIETLEHAGLIKACLIGDNVIIEMTEEKAKALKLALGE